MLITALVIAMVMTLALGVSVFAAESDTATVSKFNTTVTVSGIAKDNTLNLYRIVAFNLDESNNSISYTLATGLPSAYDTIDELGALAGTGYTYNNDANTKACADALANAIAEGTLQPLATITQAAGSDEIATKALPAGWYVATVSGTNDTKIIYQNMIVNAMPEVDEANNGYKAATAIIYEVKHTNDDVIKTVGTTSSEKEAADVDKTDQYSVGDTVPYTIKTNIPNYPNPSKVATFVITDTPDDLTDDITTGFTVTVDGSPVTAGADTFGVARPAGNDDGFAITFTKDYILAHPGQAVVVTYNAVIKPTATIGTDGETASNTAKITFNPNPNENGTVEPDDTTKDYTYGVNVYKYEEGDTTKKLTGAKFILYKEDGTTVAGAEADVDENGYVSWNGLAAGTYKLVETQAPAGYRLDSTPKEVVISATTANTDDRKSTDATETNFLQKDVPNTKGATLPSTGGIGTTIFYIVGAILVLGAGILLVTRRRMNAN